MISENGAPRGLSSDDYSLAHTFNNHLMRILALTDVLELKLARYDLNVSDRARANDLIQSTQMIRGAVFDAANDGKRALAAGEPAKLG